MDYVDIRRAREEAKRQIEMSNQAIRDAAMLIKGNLKNADVSGWVLHELKTELRDFNTKSYRWK